jgi:glycosyltransferase involved in cell wall biosynthesis
VTGPIAYLVGNYPTVSHTFISREVDGLRARGIDVQTFSIRRTPREQLLSDADRRAAAETSTILPPPPGELLAAHARALLRRPGRYLATLRLALRLSPGGARANLWHLFYFAEAMLLWARMRRRGIRHVHAHFANVATAVALLAAHYGAPQGFTWSFTMHGPSEFDDVTRFALAEKVRRARFVACIGDYCRSQLMKLVGPAEWPRLEIVRCGVDPDRFGPVDRDGRDPARLHVLCVGRLVPDKGQALLLDAIAAVRERGIDATVTFAGDGPDRATLAAAAERHRLNGAVELAGAVAQDRIPALYAAADVFCLPSLAEGVPVVLMEAMATGLPVVTTRIMGIPELVEDGSAGLLVPPGRPDELAAALERLARDPAGRAAMGRAGRAKVVREYDIADAVESLHRGLERHLAPRPLPTGS